MTISKTYHCLAYLYTVDSRYIAVQYSTILHPAQQFRMKNFGETSNSRRTPLRRPNGRAMGVFRELFGDNWPRDIGGAWYQFLQELRYFLYLHHWSFFGWGSLLTSGYFHLSVGTSPTAPPQCHTPRKFCQTSMVITSDTKWLKHNKIIDNQIYVEASISNLIASNAPFWGFKQRFSGTFARIMIKLPLCKASLRMSITEKYNICLYKITYITSLLSQSATSWFIAYAI